MAVFSKDERVKILSDIIEIQSVNEKELDVAHYLQQLFKKYDIHTEILKLDGESSRANLVAEIGSGKPVIGVSGHMDVVTTGDSDKWHYDPFKLTEDNQGRLHGRGSADMKSGLVALAISLIEIKEAGLLKQGSIRFMATAGEEVTSNGAALLHEKGYMDDIDALLIAEPSQDGIVYTHKGTMDIQVTSKGKSAHSSMPELGFNAINPLVDFIHDLNAEYNKVDVSSELLGTPTMNSTIINGGDQVNSIPEYAESLFNMRTIPQFDNKKFEDLFNRTKEKIEKESNGDITVNPYVNRDPVYTTGDNSFLKLAKSLGDEYFNRNLEVTSSTATTDASYLMKDKGEDFSFVMYGPGETGQAHQVDEYVYKDVYLSFIDLYVQLLTQYLNQSK
ncbi:ArgE/DapE family deacylase [Staphylococcus shinii]|uniref:Probable succinyl-diaminopimelate desuccinylase n=1 Tax=Staphylococcus shinii TaxID=2912228 RepID=A0A418IIE6_9STAP|nr:ArgE/DapE family deacylase [Staphylococcus shinii]MDW8565922.1 ArgE/DapE family deacylase [Staphylococcus shinii]MDW8566429.1 ArgE/DapE family deacylase [Staphylococcus shinii]PKI13561.1 succinyl-diaminopimelate desuccinylase [Staphylococcus shinii]PTI03995.1 succinyl-diaminopimelate desuccinylase [Staphylococcus shinii]RIM98698.1 ArgE/DapE family deacylase [Staphylococcus shinii]